MRRSLLVVFLLAAVLVPVPPAGAENGRRSPIVSPRFTWSMEPRFGMDSDGDGRIDLPNTHEYSHNRAPGSCDAGCSTPRFLVHFDGGVSGAAMADVSAALPLLQFAWEVRGGDLTRPLEFVRAGPTLDLLLAEGDYEVTLSVLARIPWGSVRASTTEAITVDDILIVAMGDSYASGEGNPEVPRGDGGEPALWGDGPGHAATHRSTVAWPARLALAVEMADPHTSVTLLSVAASGATIRRGMLAPQGGDLDTSQIDSATLLVGDRGIDLALVAIGGNDVGFAHIVRGLVDADPQLDPICYRTDLENVWLSAADGDWGRSSSLSYSFTSPLRIACERAIGGNGPRLAGLDGLPGDLDRLAGALEGLAPARVAMMEYSDPTGGEAGTCAEIVGDVTPPFTFHEIDRLEQTAGLERVIGPLNTELATAAARHGWTYLGGVREAFAGHGYCSEWPDYGYPEEYHDLPGFARSRLDHPTGWYRNPGRFGGGALIGGPDVSWYRTAAQSAALQGPTTRFATTGTMHPNELGHAAIARIALSLLGNREAGD